MQCCSLDNATRCNVEGVAAGASVDTYFLGGYDASQVRAPGRLNVAQMNASLESGRLYAQFTMQLPQSAEQLASGVPIM